MFSLVFIFLVKIFFGIADLRIKGSWMLNAEKLMLSFSLMLVIGQRPSRGYPHIGSLSFEDLV